MLIVVKQNLNSYNLLIVLAAVGGWPPAANFTLARYWAIVIIYFSVCEAINFEINLSFLIKLISYMNKKVGTKI